jgi:hypothetical protein
VSRTLSAVFNVVAGLPVNKGKENIVTNAESA